jgi:dihydrofolate synthase/folylpolyglutamate synthase
MFNLPKYGDGLCLARLAMLLDALSIDRVRLRKHSVVVAGSNGKGSTAAFCASIGRAFGLRTGLFTSPHLYRFNERFQIDGVPVDDELLEALVLRVATAIADLKQHTLHETFGAFEAQFALACLYFQETECEFAVFEAGIGGRYDPVRLVGADITCVTSVDLEHVNLLGNSLELIACDKSDACISGGTVVYGENCLPMRGNLAEYNRNRNVTGLHIGDEITISNVFASSKAQAFNAGWAHSICARSNSCWPASSSSTMLPLRLRCSFSGCSACIRMRPPAPSISRSEPGYAIPDGQDGLRSFSAIP